MKTLVVYYSRTGFTKKVGEEIANQLKADSEEIIDLKKRSGAVGWIISGKDAMQKKLAKIKPVKKDPEKYDRIIIGTPIWGSNMAPAIRTYLTDNKSDGKKINFFCTAGGSGMEKAFMEMKKLVPNSDVGKNLAIFSREVGSETYTEKVKSFLKQQNSTCQKSKIFEHPENL